MNKSPSNRGNASRRDVRRARALVKEVDRLAKKHRKRLDDKAVQQLQQSMDRVRSVLAAPTEAALQSAVEELDVRAEKNLAFAKKGAAREYAESLTVAVLIALFIRAFGVEAFKIPSGSMIPTLKIGDHIFVNKLIYGLRVPLTRNSWFVRWGEPERGDVVVFVYPGRDRDPNEAWEPASGSERKDYIKRVMAVAGDRVRVEGRTVYVNGEPVHRQPVTESEAAADADIGGLDAFMEEVDGHEYTVLWRPHRGRRPFPLTGEDMAGLKCGPDPAGGPDSCLVRDGFFFVMGDNRDDSEDSRKWGAAPVESVKGKAMFVWFSVGSSWWWPRWGRFGHWVE